MSYNLPMSGMCPLALVFLKETLTWNLLLVKSNSFPIILRHNGGLRVKDNCFPSTRTRHFFRSSAQPSAAMGELPLPYLICEAKPLVMVLLTT